MWKTGTNCFASWKFGIVADEAPTPGEGYRLLKKMEYDGEEESMEGGDEYWDDCWKTWKECSKFRGVQLKSIHYRRRIEPEKPQHTSTSSLQNYKVQVRYGGVVAAEMLTEKIDEISFHIVPIAKGEVTE